MLVFGLVWSLTLVAIILFRDKELVIDWEHGLRISIEGKEEQTNEEWEEIKKKA